MKIKTVILDDEPIALEKLKNYISRIPNIELSGCFSDPIEGMSFITNNEVNLIITDIQMPDLNGLELVKSIEKRPMVIFTTAYSDYAIEGYKVSAVDYLLKPYGFYEFNQAINKAIDIFNLRHNQIDVNNNQPNNELFVKVDYRYVRIDLSRIIYIKSYGEYLQIFIEGESNPTLTLSSFASIKEKLPDNFVHVHRSYVVNMNHVKTIEKNRLFLEGKMEIPIGDCFKDELQSYIANHSIGKYFK